MEKKVTGKNNVMGNYIKKMEAYKCHYVENGDYKYARKMISELHSEFVIMVSSMFQFGLIDDMKEKEEIIKLADERYLETDRELKQLLIDNNMDIY